MTDPVFGRLDWTVTPFDNLIANPTFNEFVACGAAAAVPLGGLAALFVIWRWNLWGTLWRDWITTVDHKKIGIMYILIAFVMLLRGVAEGFVMRADQAASLGGGPLSADHFAQLFSTHGTIMLLFVGMPLLTGLINFVVPLQIGARDMAFPVMNQVSLGLFAAASALIMISLDIGEFATGGWTAYPSYTGATFSPGVGVDYWIWSVGLSGLGSMLSGVNFAVTIVKMRCPGMTWGRLPVFSWATLATAIMLIYAMPPVTVSSLMLASDRIFGLHFFTNDAGGDLMNYANIFWMFGHPEVYILVLPAFGVFSEIAATYSSKKVYGYHSLVAATLCIAVISFTVWLHHFFTMGQSANVNAIFGIATMVIAIPTGVKVYNWMATMFRGRVRLTAPMVYLTGFFILFVIGGLSGVILANPSIDFQVHNSLFLVAHFHNVLIPGTLFGMFAGIHYWHPKAFGFALDEKLGRRAAWLWIVGFCVTFLPLYWLGMNGFPRRSPAYQDPSFTPWLIVAAIGACIIVSALATQVWMFWVSWSTRAQRMQPAGDPWDGRTLEWWMASPAPEWNFPVTPEVGAIDAFAAEKAEGSPYEAPTHFVDIVMPRNTSMGFAVCVITFLLGFGVIWHMWYLAILSIAAVAVLVISRAFVTRTDRIIPAEVVEREFTEWLEVVRNTKPVSRDHEEAPENRGLALPELPELVSTPKMGVA